MSEGRDTMIRVWRFKDAPEEYRALSPHGGDEDWVAIVPPAMANDYISWLEGGDFGCCDTSRQILATRETLVIGTHA